MSSASVQFFTKVSNPLRAQTEKLASLRQLLFCLWPVHAVLKK